MDLIDREKGPVLSGDEVARIIDSLEREGFLKERNRGDRGEALQGAADAVPHLSRLPRSVGGMPFPV
jgi:hypothetical protein